MKAKGCDTCVYEETTNSQRRLIRQAGTLRKELTRVERLIAR